MIQKSRRPVDAPCLLPQTPEGTTGSAKSQRLDRVLVQNVLPVLLRDYAEAARVVPHRPADVVMFERRADVLQPRETVLRLRVPVDSELVADQRHSIALRPVCGLVDFGLDAGPIPVIGAIADHVQTVDG